MRNLGEPIHAWADGSQPLSRVMADRREQRQRDSGSKFLAIAACMLGLYALIGKPFAYTFAGEILLLVGLVKLMHSPGSRLLLWQPIVAPLCLFMLWGLLRTLPFLRTYKVEAVRDAAIWGYGLWALVFAGLLCASPHMLVWMLQKYSKYLWVFLLAIPWMALIFRGFGSSLPQVPGTVGVPFIFVKTGDALCHVGGITAFCVLFNETRHLWLRVTLITVLTLMLGTSRGGLAGMFLAVMIAFAARPSSRLVWTLIVAGGFILLMLWVTDVDIHMPGLRRGINFDTFKSMVTSVTGGDTAADMEATKQWRLNWWNDIVNYTIHGKYFWTGKGFGVNLALDDGYEVMGDLRSPHNGNMNVLARMGVPGITLWILTQGGWLLSMLDAFHRSKVAGDKRWQGVFALLVGYWAAFLVNASFDVFLEGPMGGVWFWSVFGIGIASMWIYANNPQVMYPEKKTASPPPAAQSKMFGTTWNRHIAPAH